MAPRSTSIPAQLRTRDKPRLAQYAADLAFYGGKQWPSPRSARDIKRRITINYTKSIIVKVTAALLKGRTTTVEPDDDTDAARATAAEVETMLEQVAEQNALDQLDFDTELDAAVLGDGVYKVLWDPDNNMVRISAPDPSGIWAWHWPDDPTRVFRVAHQYALAPADARSLLKLSGAGAAEAVRVADRETLRITEVWTTVEMELWINDVLASTEPNPLQRIPYVIFPNIREPKRIWGTSDVAALREPQQELNRGITQISNIMELSGNPIAVLEKVDQGSDIAVAPGEVWELPEGAKAYVLDLLSGGGVQLHIDYLALIKQNLFDLGETPATAFGGIDKQLSGVAIELDLDPLVKKVERKRLLRTEAYQERNELIIQTMAAYGGVDYAGAKHGIAWGSILPTDRDRQVANAIALSGAGIHSRRTEVDNLGGIDDPDAEFARWVDEQTTIDAISDAPGQDA